MTIRKFKNSDWESYKECVLSQWEDDYSIGKEHRIWCYEYFDPFYHYNHFLYDSNYVVLVAVDENDEVHGFNIGKVVQNYMEIIALYVNPIMRSENVGKTLKIALRDLAMNMGLEYITALNRYDNPVSMNMNKKMGWIIKEINDDYYRAFYYFKQHTILEWESLFETWKILDPDGFDRTDPQLYERTFTQEDFFNRSQLCTLMDWQAFIQNNEENTQ